jgi:peptidoglycan biosynthesis protein MviN/MurJ (putative lipid II flippase)
MDADVETVAPARPPRTGVAARSLAAAFAVVVGSRILGLFREILITLTFGFSKITDLFFQANFVPTYLLNVLNGSFTTAFLASFNAAPPAERGAWLRLYRRRALTAGLWCAPLFLMGGAAAALLAAAEDRGAVLATCALLAPACTAVVVVGYMAASANACGMIARANALTTLLNAVFVAGVLALWASNAPAQPWMLPGAFALASACAALVGWRWMDRMIAEQEAGWGPQSTPSGHGLPGLRRGFLLAFGENAGAIFTHFVVLALASHAGVGWASAAALAQRLSLSAVGLLVTPPTNLACIAIIREPARAPAIFTRTVLAMVLGAAALAAGLVWLEAPLEAALVAGSRLDAASASLLAALISPFALWLVAVATYIPVNRTLFAIRRGRLCTTTTLCGYALANAARIWAALSGDFALAVGLGAAIELILALGLAVVARNLLRTRASLADAMTQGPAEGR